VACLKKGVVRRDCIRAKVEQGIRRVQMLKEIMRTRHEGGKGMKDLGGDDRDI
jgi:hypothetical protein